MHDLAELLVHFVQHALRALPVFASLRLALPNKRGRKILQFDAGEDFLDVADAETFALVGVGRKLWVAFTQRIHGCLAESDFARGGNRIACSAGSFVSSGRGHRSPHDSARPRTLLTVFLPQPQENAMLL